MKTKICTAPTNILNWLSRMDRAGIRLCPHPYAVGQVGLLMQSKLPRDEFITELRSVIRRLDELRPLVHRERCRSCLTVELDEHEREGEPICLDCVIAGREIPDVVRWVIRDDPLDRSR